MELRINEKAKSVRDLFIQGKLEECINLASQFDQGDEDFNSYQYTQIYKGLSYYELSQEIEGLELFQSLIEQSKSKKGSRVEALEVIMYSLFQWQNFDYNRNSAYETQLQFLTICKEYHLQNNEKEDYNEYLYKFGNSMYQFIESIAIGAEEDQTKIQEFMSCVDKINYLKEEVLFLIGWQFDYLNHQAQALKWYGVLVKENHQFPGVLNNIALAYGKEEDFDNAEKYFLKSLEGCPYNAIVLTNIAIVYEKTHQKEKAVYYYEKALKSNPTQIFVYTRYTEYLQRCLENEAVKQVLFKGLEYPKIYIPILSILIRYAVQLKHLDESLEYLNKQISSDPGNGIFEFDYALLLQDDDDNMSLEFFQRCLKKNLPPSKIKTANFNMAYLYSQLDRYEECFQQIVYTCGLNIEGNYDNEYEYIAHEFNEGIIIATITEKIKFVESLNGIILTRLDKIIPQIESPLIKSLFQCKLDLYVNILNFVAYQKSIQSLLTFQSGYVHWDLFLD